VNVVWTDTANAQLTNIYDFIARDSAQYALRMIDRITSRSNQLSAFPESGEIVPEYSDPTVREVIEGPYRIIYRLGKGSVDVLSVIHGAHLLPPQPPST
jgi:plasmid stabilization system protein ParE